MKWQIWVAVIALVVGALLPMSPASTWTRADADASAAAGAPQGSRGPDGLDNARRATSDAASQLSLLTAGTSQLVEGVGEFDKGKQSLVDALSSAETGSRELSNGMVQLQAGTGQLATGATQVADTIGGVVDQVAGFDAVRGQVVASIDRALEGTKGSKDRDVVEARKALEGLRSQAVTAEIPPDALVQMNQLRDGSRELANQLSVPGYAYHDGVYTATNGAAELAKGLKEMNENSGEIVDGIEELTAGAERIDEMAKKSSEKVSAVRAALPVAPAAAANGQTANGQGAEAEQVQVSSLSPVAAMLIAALLTLGGVALAGAAMALSRRNFAVFAGGAVLLALASWILVVVLGAGFDAGQLAIAGLALLLGAFAAAGLPAALASAFGAPAGFGVASALALVQVGLVGWVWRTAAAAPVAGAWLTASSAAPMHWTTAALSANGNNGSLSALISSLLLSLVLATAGLAAIDARTRRGDGHDL
ncbi:hypothetical protein CGLAU_00780 [Corynebacterium glaucum]|uniref:Uncharacterized protein n=1 Tax=Corynebacterium glaucum TaxID=187491 RepID=A0A1Q2HTI3_9CORY|nr:hypothetical protein [Corynebacterium glaucum]AQQ14151.1 hypothetical protein CGLAU_00780 [Corynebacterium glaucum]WJZ06673.1 hypothetical protein CGLAUT_00795 [Corynebacterium glaucum]